jgi:uncharacterized membrane protein (UPF0127 family)
MKGCVVGLDMLFLSKDLRVVDHVTLPAMPAGTADRDLPAHTSRVKCRHVLELRAGTARDCGFDLQTKFRARPAQ